VKRHTNMQPAPKGGTEEAIRRSRGRPAHEDRPSREPRHTLRPLQGHALTAASTASSWLQLGFAKFCEPRAVLADFNGCYVDLIRMSESEH